LLSLATTITATKTTTIGLLAPMKNVQSQLKIAISGKGAGLGFAWARIDNFLLYSCYCTLNCTIQEFDTFICGIDQSNRNQLVSDAVFFVGILTPTRRSPQEVGLGH